jgi:xanthine dehydrogenase small subunit
MRDHILLYVNGRPVRVFGDDAFLTLSDFLRRRQNLPGTKVVCAEGDCGSCAVLIGRVEGDRIRYASVTSCIQLVFQLDGAHVVTVEGLRSGRGELNAVQQAMVACQGTQCGFCTPGFVVSVCDMMQTGETLDAEKVRRGLVGNLCRCTGYDSIIRAALAVKPGEAQPIDVMYPPRPIVTELSRASGEEVRIESRSKKFYKPIDVTRAARFRGEQPDCVVIAGATDMGVVYNKRTRAIDVALSLGGLAELRSVSCDGEAMYVGACATLTALELAALEHLPELGRFLAYFGSPLIKNAGTLGGNLVTGSPIGDTIPALMALEADVDIAGTGGTRRVPIGQFYAGYRQTILGPDELVTGVHIPLPKPGETFRLYKVSRRKDLDISGFGAAIWMKQTNGTVDDVRIVYGGVGPMVMRMSKAEAVLRGRSPTLEHFAQAADVARDEVTPITDVRGSEQYRRTLAKNILLKFWHESVAGTSGNNGDGNGSPTPHEPPSGVRRTLIASGGGGGA